MQDGAWSLVKHWHVQSFRSLRLSLSLYFSHPTPVMIRTWSIRHLALYPAPRPRATARDRAQAGVEIEKKTEGVWLRPWRTETLGISMRTISQWYVFPCHEFSCGDSLVNFFLSTLDQCACANYYYCFIWWIYVSSIIYIFWIYAQLKSVCAV